MAYEITLLTTMSIAILFALSLNVITGFCGQVSLGHAAFFGIGAYTAALLAKAGVPLALALLPAGVMAGAVGFVVGLASLRVRHDFLAITNAFNLLDNMDGLSSGVAAICLLTLFLFNVLLGNPAAIGVVCLALAGALVGFLLFNFHPAKIFMGDSGSLFLGFTIATASVLTTAKSEALVGFGLPVLVLGIPIFDTLLSMMRRFLARRGITSPDRGHFHHRLLDKGFKQHHVAIIAYAITLVASGVGFLLLATHRGTSLMVFMVGLTIILVIFKLVGSVGIHQILSDISTRSSIANARRIERQKYEASQLEFRTVENYEQWWACMCRAAKALDFARMSMELASEKGQVKTWCSESCPDEEGDETMEGLLQMKVPIKGERNGDVHRMEIQVLTSGSLESAGRRAVLFTRLADENRLDKLVEKEIH